MRESQNVLILFAYANNFKFTGSVSMVLGKLYKHNGNWKFSAIGEKTSDKNLTKTMKTAEMSYL
jgi:tellurium resistance protein TerZ